MTAFFRSSRLERRAQIEEARAPSSWRAGGGTVAQGEWVRALPIQRYAGDTNTLRLCSLSKKDNSHLEQTKMTEPTVIHRISPVSLRVQISDWLHRHTLDPTIACQVEVSSDHVRVFSHDDDVLCQEGCRR